MDESFESKLSQGGQRFLAHVIEHGLESGRRTHEDFLRHFPPHAIMEALAEQPKLRANILAIATGLRSRIAVKKTPADSAVDLDIALAEDEADAETVVTLFDPDDRVRYLAAEDLWKYIVEGEFWTADPSDTATFLVARGHIEFMLTRSLADRVISARDVVEGTGVDQLAVHLPPAELAKVLKTALGAGRDGSAFTDEQLIAEVPVATLVQHVPLPVLWSGVIEGRVAKALGVAPRPKPAIAPPAARDESAATDASPPAAPEADEAPDAPPAPAPAQPVAVAKPAEAGPRLPSPKNALGRMPLVKKPVARTRAAVEENAAPPRKSRRPKKKNSKAPKPRRSKRPAAKA